VINTDSFGKQWGIVEHTLPADYWTWDRINTFTDVQQTINRLYYRYFGNGGFTVGGLDTEPFCKTVLEFLHPLAPTHYARAGLYAGTKSDSKTFNLHKDPGQHLWVWQVIGDTPWQVGDQQFVLKKDQVLYVPAGMDHCAIPDSPRASISFSLEEFD